VSTRTPVENRESRPTPSADPAKTVGGKLRQHERDLRLIIDTIPGMIWSARPDGVIDFVNQRWIDFGGGAWSGDAGAWDWLRSVHPDDVPEVREKWTAHLASGEPYELEMRVRRADGEYRWFMTRAVPLRDETGAIVRWYGTNVDIQDRKEAEKTIRQKESEQREARTAVAEALESVRKSEDRLRLVIDTIPAMVASSLPDGTLDFANKRWEEYSGIVLQDSPARSLNDASEAGWANAIHPDDAVRHFESWLACTAAGEPGEIETRVRRADGEFRWFLHRVAPLRDEHGVVVRWYGTSTDIEDRKCAERLLAGEKLLLEMIARGNPLAPILDALCRLTEELTHGALSSILLLDAKTGQLRHGAAPSLPAAYSAAIDGALIGPAVGSCGTAAYRGEPVVVADIAIDPLWVDYRDLALAHGLRACSSTPIRSSKGEILGTFATYYREPRSPSAEEQSIIDRFAQIGSIALEREQGEEALRQQARLLDLTHDAIVGWELPGTIVYWNRGAERLYGFSRAEAIGRTNHDLLRTEHPLPPELFARLIERDGAWTGEFTHRTRGGRRVVVDSRQVLLHEADGRRLVLETNRDITDRRRAEEALSDAKAQLAHVTRITTLGEVTASLAHEVNQPLAAIVNNANACLGLLPDRRDLDEVREALGDIVSDSVRAGAIVERVRGFSKRSAPEKTPLCLADVVDDVVALIAAEVATRNVVIRADVAPDLPVILGDRVQLQQVLLNLVVNGMDAMSAVAEGERLLEICGRADHHDGSPAALISVADRGTGLDPGQADRIFDAFYTTKPHGMGIGLAISRSIIQAHGGRLWAESNEGPGATFSFRLPAARPATS